MWKNWMNAATDLQKTQLDLLNQPVVCVLRSVTRVQRWTQMFKRTTTMVLRRYRIFSATLYCACGV